MAHLYRVVNILTALLLISGCGSVTYMAPINTLDQPPSYRITSHIVAKQETLYSIAWRYTMDVNDLGQINGLSAPYTVYPGQQLNLDITLAPKAISKKQTDKSKLVITRSKSAPSQTLSKNSPIGKRTSLAWRWPVRGPVVTRFAGENTLSKGVDIKVEKGHPVLAAESGTIVYAGTGLRGYGKLLIVKHNENYLSAYAHNDRLLSAEGEKVKAGQKIAETGSSGTDSGKLHFEIRLNGKPVDPLRYLPKQ